MLNRDGKRELSSLLLRLLFIVYIFITFIVVQNVFTGFYINFILQLILRIEYTEINKLI